MLKNFDWPGNVRQLENSVFRAMILSDGHRLKPQDFPQISGLTPVMSAPADPLENLVSSSGDDYDNSVSVLDRDGHLRTLEEIEKDLIAFAIDNYSGHMSEIARRLGIGRSTLYRKVREHGMDVDNVRSA
jgi:DNA-binding NtrC family response regulator